MASGGRREKGRKKRFNAKNIDFNGIWAGMEGDTYVFQDIYIHATLPGQDAQRMYITSFFTFLTSPLSKCFELITSLLSGLDS